MWSLRFDASSRGHGPREIVSTLKATTMLASPRRLSCGPDADLQGCDRSFRRRLATCDAILASCLAVLSLSDLRPSGRSKASTRLDANICKMTAMLSSVAE